VPIPLDNKRIQDVRPGDAIITTSDTQVCMVLLSGSVSKTAACSCQMTK
jgi:hypothetical protein